MSKYIIEINDIGIEDVKDGEKYHRVTRVPWWYISETNLNRLDLYNETESAAEQRGAEKAWELAQKIRLSENSGGMSLLELNECFGTCAIHEIFSNSYSEVAQMYEAWVKQDEEIKVGDEVRSRINRSKICVVTNIMKVGENTQFNCLQNDGKTDWFSSTKNFEKTGRHFPEIVELLKKMEGE